MIFDKSKIKEKISDKDKALRFKHDGNDELKQGNV